MSEAKPVQEGDLKQRQLFTPDMLPEMPELLVYVHEKRYEHTGKIIGKNEELCAAIVTDIALGVSERTVAKKYGVSRNSIGAAREALERAGKLEPLKERIAGLLSKGIVIAAEETIDAMRNGTLPKQCLPVVVGIFTEKRALVLGEPTAISATAAPEGMSVEALNAAIAKLPSANVQELPTVPDNQSENKPA